MTRPLAPVPTEWPTGLCQWGRCDQPAIDWRWSVKLRHWVAVCDIHKRAKLALS